ncbi:Alpha/Beta hydrolase fold [Naviculisporaceae sp. PSN 640]
MEHQTISLTTKPGSYLHLSTLFPEPARDNPLKNLLLVFLNGLILPSSLWDESINHLVKLRTDSHLPAGLISYDRFGQGDSDPDPADPPDTQYGHDARTAVADLHQLLSQISQDRLKRPLRELSLVFVCNSIGCPLARIYAATYPGTVSGLLFLDSMMANSDFVDSLFPDPDHGEFDPGSLPEGVSIEDIRYARDRFRAFFHPTVTNPERFDRRNLAELLPHADRPRLPEVGLRGRLPRTVVVGHDPDEFATQCEEGSLSVPERIIKAFVDPVWTKYNKGLSKLGYQDPRDSDEVKIAKGCGHFIQRDDAMFVAKEICSLLDYLSQPSVW